jgi:hypothetical protein
MEATITGVGHCRQVGCPLTGLAGAVKALTDAGHKVWSYLTSPSSDTYETKRVAGRCAGSLLHCMTIMY